MNCVIEFAISRHRALVFVAIVMCSFFGGADGAKASPTWAELKGHSACGGVDERGNLQPACDYERATLEGKAVGSCPKGSFFDIGTWSCFTCPNGFSRNAKSVTSEKACQKNVPDETAPATFLKAVSCPSGSFLDPRNGGECWQCPKGLTRTTAKVDAWNACGMAGKKAQAAIFKRKACPGVGSFVDPRKGGECWICPEDYHRTASPVAGAKACKIALAFKPASKSAALTCKAGQHFDFIDGGTCWSCPEGSARTWFNVKKDKACRNKKMKWEVPRRQLPSLFSFGKGADDILAKLIADRTRIDALIKETAKQGGVDEATALEKGWQIIDSAPWKSPYLATLLRDVVIEAGHKPAKERTDSEKDLLATIALYVQWDRQFIAYQAKQAHDTWVETSEKVYAETTKKSGAAAIYSDNMVTPPDYNDLVVGVIQGGAMIAGPVGDIGITMLLPAVKQVIMPHNAAVREALAKAAEKAAQEAAKKGLQVAATTGASTSSTVMAATAGPMIIVAALGIMVTMEIDKFAALAKAEGKIRQSIAIAERPVDLPILFQKKGGVDEFTFHWAALVGGKAPPSANFKARLAAYKAGTDPDAVTTGLDASKLTIGGGTNVTTVPQQQTVEDLFDVFNSTTTKPKKAQPKKAQPSSGELIERAVKGQAGKGGSGAMRIELSDQAGQCLAKIPGKAPFMTLGDCADKYTTWIAPDMQRKSLKVAGNFCLGMAHIQTEAMEPGQLIIESCNYGKPSQIWELTSEGLIKLSKAPTRGLPSPKSMASTDQCLTVGKDKKLILQPCGTDLPNQTWRPLDRR